MHDERTRINRERHPSEGAHEYEVAPKQAEVVVVVGLDKGERFWLRGTAIAGRGPTADIRLSHDDISREHIRIEPTEDGDFSITDLNSKNGTFVNGLRVHSRQLQSGDKLRLGTHTVLLFTVHDAAHEKLLQSQRLESIGRLAGGVAHEFNNLLGTVLANVSYLQGLSYDHPLGEREVQSCLEEVVTVSKKAAYLTQQLQMLSREERDGFEPVDLSMLAQEVVQLAQRTFNRNIGIRTSLSATATTTGDRAELHQALMNLFLNARDAMRDGGTLTVETQRATLGPADVVGLPLLAPGDFVVVTVRDDGAGMDVETRQRVFDPFFTTKEGRGGAGLGLATAYGIINNHGGYIDLESAVGQGTTVRIYLPASSPPQQRTPPPPPPLRHPAPTDPQFTVLVVDDEPHLRSAAQRLLRQLGHEVFVAEDGIVALEIYEANKDQVDVVLLDLIMPQISGEETFRELRGIDPDVRVILTSGYSDPHNIRGLVGAGACGFIAKPYDVDALGDAVLRAASLQMAK